MNTMRIRRRSLPDSLRWLADKLDSSTLTDVEQAGVALMLRMLADEINPPAAPAADGDPDTMCGASHRAGHHGVARCSRGQGHDGAHSGYAYDGASCQWVPDATAEAQR